MYNTYTNSAWSIRRGGFHDHSYLLAERSERYPFAVSSSSSRFCRVNPRSCSCCCCCSASSSSFVKPQLFVNPRFLLYGLSQSTLIRWPSFRRRLLVGGSDRHFDRFLGCEDDGHHCEVSCSSRERYCVGARRNRGFRLRVSEDPHECCDGDGLDDVEALITLLSEEVVHGCSCSRERTRSSVRKVEEKKRVKYGGEFGRANVRRVEIEERTNSGNGRSTWKNKRDEPERREKVGREEYRRKERAEEVGVRENYDCEHCGRRRKKSSQLENGSWQRHAYKSDAVESRGESSRKSEEREARPTRTKSSSCSSYYSLSSSGEFESDIEVQDEAVGYHRENQKKSEKKLVEVSAKGLKSRKEASQTHSRGKLDETDNGMSSTFRKQVYEQEGKSNQTVALTRRRRKQYSQTGGRVSESRRNFEEDTEIHEIHVNDMEMNSKNQKVLSGKEEDNRVISVRTDTGRENIERSTQQLNERSGIRYTGEERTLEMLRQSKYSSGPDEDRNELRDSVQEINEQRRRAEEKMSTRTGLRQRTDHVSQISEIHNTDIRNTSVSLVENCIRNQEAHTSLVSGLHSEAGKQHYRMDQIPSRETQSNKNSVSVSPTSDVIRVTESQRTSETRISGQESTSIVQLGFGEASSSQSSLTSVSQNRLQQVNLDSEEMRPSQTVLIPPPSQSVNRGSGHSFQTGGATIQDVSYGTSESPYDSVPENPEGGTHINSGSAGELMRITAHEDALGSAERLEQSSEQLIGEFMEKAEYVASSSETQGEKAESLKRRNSRQSGGSGGKGPSDEMWVTDSARGTPQPGVAESTAAGGNDIVKRSGRSLWSIIADIARLRWSPRAGSPDSVAKPSGKSSPDESVSTATWFSGREHHDGSSDDNAKGEKPVSLQEAASPYQLEVGQTPSGNQSESSSSMKLRPQSGRHEVSVSSPSSGKLELGSASIRLSSMSGDQSVGKDEKFETRLPETGATETPLLLPGRSLRRSPVIKEPSESSPAGQNAGRKEGRSFQTHVPATGTVQKPSLQPGHSLISPVTQEFPPLPHLTMVPGSSSSREQEEQQPVSARSHEETAKDSVSKQKKFQRNMQVVKDRFDEWEEAYRQEAERRKIDEMFMREALVEAKKAADMWEVPVGAVLVHDGKIIARGCNLVEELRDSTAHAEMICIREASQVLRSWRLADTTLYVTLEPCPMCAGAILQARVKTLVWGAPNKLLGADGSWIRLFPGGEGNDGSDKPAAPVHPFHPKMTIRRGVLESECTESMQQFFQLRRKKTTDNKTTDKNSDLPAVHHHHHHHHHPSKLLNKMHQILPFFCI
ncbi:PREDICTED: tRNA(adenine(34)) deaminase, chloroplastic [Tarenaya hassleriana]|uniref:tRNA(adenine(34)) deaminase, chloroplastic n=1 Tax=Tarenaya hassleriana TaxID=28532 RepID=UPI00053C6538|nr:PREDICTED: tRNA(adenine(34)) deaminase, chloroplastic [Tarenaya hassleriana]